jgi:hypothetical protein
LGKPARSHRSGQLGRQRRIGPEDRYPVGQSVESSTAAPYGEKAPVLKHLSADSPENFGAAPHLARLWGGCRPPTAPARIDRP